MNEIAAAVEKAIRYARELDAETLNAFHRKAMETPTATLPHLIFADYLEENGEPTAAELIRRAAERRSPSRGVISKLYSQSPLRVDHDRDSDFNNSLILEHTDTSHPGDERGWRPYFYHYLPAEPEDLHRLLKGMTHVDGRDEAMADLLAANPHLHNDESPE